jgi:hypothetical protein
MANELERPAPPALPLATETYDRPFMDQNSNVLRLFFTRLINAFDNLVSTDNGGKFLYSPVGTFYSTQDQSAAVVNTGYAVTFNNTVLNSGVTLSNNSRINVTDAGVYQFNVTLQLEHNNASDAQVTIYEEKNGSAVAYSGHEFHIKGNDYDVLNWEFMVSLAASDYIEIYWATDDTGVNLHTEAASSPHPGVPSASIDVTFVSNV